DPEAAVEALGDTAVVDEHADLGHADVAQRAERLGHDERQLDLVVVGQLARTDHVDVGLRELAEAAVLGAAAAPPLLDLVALEREREVPGVLEDVARERDREVEVQAELLVAPARRVGVARLLLQAPQDVDLLGRLALAQELVERLDRARLDPAEPVQLEHPAQDVEDVLLDDPTVGEAFGETGERCGPGHGSDLPGRGPPRPHRPGRRTRLSRRGTGWSRARARPSWPGRARAARPTPGRGARRRRAESGPSARRRRRAGRCARPSPRPAPPR